MTQGLPAPPSRYLRRVQWRRAHLAALDFEATGLDFSRDSIISFGIVPIDDGRIIMRDAAYGLVNPEVAPSRESVAIHGLRARDLADAPGLDECRETLREGLSGRFLVTWWAEVETRFLEKIFGGGRRRLRARTIDVRKLVLRLEAILGERRGPDEYTLAATAARYRIPVASPHHALDDALVTAQLLLVVAPRLAARGHKTVRSLVRISR
ncbi:MAG TPA: exonuclease domain-containing protein [Actinomycetota bacterium]|nr:exonuclease domain-containing protein [Actinomycetota bacterium]